MKTGAAFALYDKQRSHYRLKVPTLDADSSCPDLINSELINASVPAKDSTDLYSSTFNLNGRENRKYFNFNVTDNPSSCNIGKVIDPLMSQLQKEQADLLQLIDNLNSLISSLDKKEQEIYTTLITQQDNLNKETEKYNKIKEKNRFSK